MILQNNNQNTQGIAQGQQNMGGAQENGQEGGNLQNLSTLPTLQGLGQDSHLNSQFQLMSQLIQNQNLSDPQRIQNMQSFNGQAPSLQGIKTQQIQATGINQQNEVKQPNLSAQLLLNGVQAPVDQTQTLNIGSVNPQLGGITGFQNVNEPQLPQQFPMQGLQYTQVQPRQPLEPPKKTRYSKLERLLAQPDIFDTLRRMGRGDFQSYDQLDMDAGMKKREMQLHMAALKSQRTKSKGGGIENNDQNAIDEFNQNSEFEVLKLEKQPPNLVGGQLRDYQLEGLNWLFKLYQANVNGILADEMGLGKTIQSVSILALIDSMKSESERMNRMSHHIVIVPKVTLGKWNKEVQQWAPSLRLFQFFGSAAERDEQRKILRKHQYDIILTTFETCMAERGELGRMQFEYLILDEAQRIKNRESVLARDLRTFSTKNRILLTGTPLQNNLTELWALLNFLMPKLFESSEDFTNLFVMNEDGQDQEKEQEKVIKQIHRLLKPFMLRRLKADVERSLPTKEEIYLFVGLTMLQKQLYKKILTGNAVAVNAKGNKDRIALLNVLMQLKKVCNHPYLFDGIEEGPPFLDGDHIVNASMKFRVLDHLIPKLLGENCKILIFSQMTRLLDILDDFLRMRGYKYCRIDGQTAAQDRDQRIEDFQDPNSDKQLFLLSTRAGGIGVNLHAANIVILFDSDWNPQVDLQAIGRAHRIGQRRDVVIYRFVTEESVEEKIVERAARKLQVDHLIMQGAKLAESGNNPMKPNTDEVRNMIRHGAHEIISCKEDDDQFHADLDKIIDKSLKKTKQWTEQLKSIKDKFNLNNVSLTGEEEGGQKTSIYKIEGQEFTRKQIHENENKEWKPIIEEIGPRASKIAQRSQVMAQQSYRGVTQSGPSNKKKSKGWKASVGGGFDHQFFDNKKLDELENKETLWTQYEADPEQWIQSGKKEIPAEFTPDDQEMKETLLSQGFASWNKRDFYKYINMCELYGRQNLELYMDLLVGGKTIEEITKYSKAFWKNYHRLDNYKKYIERIERGEAEIAKRMSIDKAIDDKFQQLKDRFKKKYPEKEYSEFTIDDIEIQYQKPVCQEDYIENPFEYHPDEDKFYAMGMFKYTYGFWELLKNDIRNSQYFLFNWVVYTRTILDIEKRCDFLIAEFKKELYNEDTPVVDAAQKKPKGDTEEKKKKKEYSDDEDEEEGEDQVEDDESFTPGQNALKQQNKGKKGKKPKKRGRKPKNYQPSEESVKAGSKRSAEYSENPEKDENDLKKQKLDNNHSKDQVVEETAKDENIE